MCLCSHECPYVYIEVRGKLAVFYPVTLRAQTQELILEANVFTR